MTEQIKDIKNGNIISEDEKKYYHKQNFISKELSSILLNLLRDCLIWEPFILSPKSRLTSRWSYTGGTKEIDILLEGLIVQIQQQFKTTINKTSVFLNWYKNGRDRCPYHADKYNCDVFTISLGQTRDLLIKRNGPGKAEKITLKSGDLYYMSNSIQLTHKHSIPSRKKAKDERISIVFFSNPILIVDVPLYGGEENQDEHHQEGLVHGVPE